MEEESRREHKVYSCARGLYSGRVGRWVICAMPYVHNTSYGRSFNFHNGLKKSYLVYNTLQGLR